VFVEEGDDESEFPKTPRTDKIIIIINTDPRPKNRF
jgi:hypothetical protein